MRNRSSRQEALRDTSGRGPSLVETAAEMFRERGYDGTSMSDIADALGLLKGSIYHYINSKEELLYAVVKLTHQENLDLLDLTTYPSEQPTAMLEDFVRRNLSYIAAHPANVIAFDTEYRRLSEEHREEIVEQRKQYRSFLTAIIERGQADGSFRDDLDAKLASILIVSTLNNVARWYDRDGPWTTEVVAEHCRMMLQGLTSHGPPRR